MNRWFEETGQDASNVVYSRLRLSRNLDNRPFPAKLGEKEGKELLAALKEGLKGMEDARQREFELREGGQMRELERQAMRERRLLNSAAVGKNGPWALMASEDEAESLILNVDDHIRLQLLGQGLCLEQLWERADKMDDWINERFPYAFDGKYGYLTAFPTNVGTGLRCCAVMHLPALSKVKKFQSIVADMGRFGTAIRGLYGEGADNYGGFYEISNQRTLGLTEREIVELVTKAAAQLNNQENRVRSAALNSQRLDKEDEAYKSYGVLRYARKITEKDARIFLSILMEAQSGGLLSFETPVSLYGILLGIKPASLRLASDRPLDKDEVDTARAAYIRERLPRLTANEPGGNTI